MDQQLPPQAPQGQAIAPPQQNQLALWSLILGLLALFMLGPLTGIPAIICGHMSRKKIKQSNGQLEGAGMSLAGLILGYVATILSIVILFGAIAMFGLFNKTLKTQLEDAAYQLETEQVEEIIEIEAERVPEPDHVEEETR